MTGRRMEAFSDGVIAILITIMVLELHRPSGPHFSDLRSAYPSLLAYVLSFVYLGIYWNNHHHLLMTVRKVSGAMLWANLALLFCLSLFPFATVVDVGERVRDRHRRELRDRAGARGVRRYTLLQSRHRALPRRRPATQERARARSQGRMSFVAYVVSIPLAFVVPMAVHRHLHRASRWRGSFPIVDCRTTSSQ